MTKEEYKTNKQFAEVSDLAIKLSSDRRILIDFLETVACSPNKEGKYTLSREKLQSRALDLIEDLGLNKV